MGQVVAGQVVAGQVVAGQVVASLQDRGRGESLVERHVATGLLALPDVVVFPSMTRAELRQLGDVEVVLVADDGSRTERAVPARLEAHGLLDAETGLVLVAHLGRPSSLPVAEPPDLSREQVRDRLAGAAHAADADRADGAGAPGLDVLLPVPEGQVLELLRGAPRPVPAAGVRYVLHETPDDVAIDLCRCCLWWCRSEPPSWP